MQTLDAIMRRRTIMAYGDRPVESDKIDTILEAARWAPSGGNSQPWDFVVITDPALKTQVRDLVKEGYARWMTEAIPQACTPEQIESAQCSVDPIMGEGVTFIVATKTFRESPEPAARAKREFVEAMNYESLGLALENLMLAATDLGLGTHWFAPVSLMQDEMHELLGMPPETEVVALLTLGYPAAGESEISGGQRPRTRLPLSEIVHHNRW